MLASKLTPKITYHREEMKIGSTIQLGNQSATWITEAKL